MRASQLWHFFCVVSPGHETAALEEFQAKAAYLGLSSVTAVAINGGFEIEAPWELGRGLVHILKIPTRVVIRLKRFSARDFPKLFNSLSTLPWTTWLQHPTPQVRITAHKCRLIHTGRIEETFFEALKKAHSKQPFSTRYITENLPADLLILRGENDQWTLSLDIAGEALYKRGSSHIKGEAPIRETHAAAVLWELFRNHEGGPITLIDPMCGSGTIVREAMDFFKPATRTFNYITSPINKGVLPWKPKSTLTSWPIQEAVGLDIKAELIGKLKSQDSMRFEFHDLLNHPLIPHSSPIWIISNPPYGERLGIEDNLSDFAHKLSLALGLYAPSRVALIVPRSFPSIKVRGLKVRGQFSFSNGGIPVEARVFQ